MDGLKQWDPREFRPENNFLAGGGRRTVIAIDTPEAHLRNPAVAALDAAAASRDAPSVLFMAGISSDRPLATAPLACFDWPDFDLEDHRCCSAIAQRLAGTAPIQLLLPDLIQRLADPRPFLALLRSILQALSGSRCLLSTPDRTNSPVHHPGDVRRWTAEEFCLAMQLSGFSIAPLAIAPGHEIPGTMFWELTSDHAAYLRMLHACHLPAPAPRLVLNEVPPGQSACLPALVLTTRHVPGTPSEVLHLHDFGLETGADAVLAAVLHILFIYPDITWIELPDHLGLGYRVTQAKRAGMLPPQTQVVTYALENALTLNAATREVDRKRPPLIAAAERLCVELADLAVFPDEATQAAYVEDGGMLPRAACVGETWRQGRAAAPGRAAAAPGAVTVLMTSFNAEASHLVDAAEGLRHAFRRPDQVVVVDDHSSAADFEVLRAFATDALRGIETRIIRLPGNLGPAAARNAGLASITTPYVCGHDHDNVMLNRFLAVGCRMLDENPQLAAVTTWMSYFDDGDDWRVAQAAHRDYRPVGGDLGLALTENSIGDHMAVYRTSALREIGGWDTRGRAMWEDWQLLCRLLAAGFDVWTVPEVMHLHRVRPDSRTATEAHFGGWLLLAGMLPALPRRHAVSIMHAAWHRPDAAAMPAPAQADCSAQTPGPQRESLAAELDRLRAEIAGLREETNSNTWRLVRRGLSWLDQRPVLLGVLRLLLLWPPRPGRSVQDVRPARDPMPGGRATRPGSGQLAAESASRSGADPNPPRLAADAIAPEALRAIGRALAGPLPSAAAALHGGPPRVSIIVPTDCRPESLDNLLDCLRYQDGPPFEVIVIAGPTENGTERILSKWSGAIKTTRCDERNTSRSRNLGIALAAGEIIALIDDDALPEPDWLATLVAGFEDPQVGAVGGAVFDHTGTQCQMPYISVNRLGHMDMSWTAPTEEFNFPLTYHIPFAHGTNCAFRHQALRAVGGFDEEYEYYYDETDLCCRLVDAGWQIRQLPGAFVHHKMLASHIRSDARIMHNLFTPLKGKLYFSLVNNHGHYPKERALEDMRRHVFHAEESLKEHVAAGRLGPEVLERFAVDAERAWSIGLERGTARRRRLATWASAPPPIDTFVEFPRTRACDQRRTLVYACITPDDDGRLQAQARATAALGHHVHVVLPGEGHDRVDFEAGSWVYRFLDPLDAILRISRRWSVDLLCVPDRGKPAELEWAKTIAARLGGRLAAPTTACPHDAERWICCELPGVRSGSTATEPCRDSPAPTGTTSAAR